MRYLTAAILTASLAYSFAVQADELIRKGGEWRSTVTGIGPEPQTMDMCFKQATLEEAMANMSANQKCSKKDMKVSGNVVTMDLVCGAMAMQGTATLAGDTAYHADITMQMTIGGNVKTIHSLTDSKWIGPCTPRQKPIN